MLFKPRVWKKKAKEAFRAVLKVLLHSSKALQPGLSDQYTVCFYPGAGESLENLKCSLGCWQPDSFSLFWLCSQVHWIKGRQRQSKEKRLRKAAFLWLLRLWRLSRLIGSFECAVAPEFEIKSIYPFSEPLIFTRACPSRHRTKGHPGKGCL